VAPWQHYGSFDNSRDLIAFYAHLQLCVLAKEFENGSLSRDQYIQ